MRLYNGAPDSELKAIWDARDEAQAKLRQLDPEAICIRFYACHWHGDFWQVWSGTRPISSENSVSSLSAMREAIALLGGENI